jgi:hypothetical protein
MFRNACIRLVLGAGIAASAFAADVVIHVAPPRPIVERRVVSPGRDYVWVPGYHRWDGRGYVWVPGRWERPPHHRAKWVHHKYVRRNGGWVFVEGHWR